MKKIYNPYRTANATANYLTPILFADDTTLVLLHSNVIKNVNDGLLVYANWFNLNKLCLNIF